MSSHILVMLLKNTLCLWGGLKSVRRMTPSVNQNTESIRKIFTDDKFRRFPAEKSLVSEPLGVAAAKTKSFKVLTGLDSVRPNARRQIMTDETTTSLDS